MLTVTRRTRRRFPIDGDELARRASVYALAAALVYCAGCASLDLVALAIEISR